MFERNPTRTDIVSLSAWKASNEKTTEQIKAIQDRERRDWEAYELALKRYQRQQMPFPVRFVLGLVDVAKAFVRGGR